MAYRIQQAVVLGAGTMGAAIAAHLANVGIPSDLLDIVPTSTVSEDERSAGCTLTVREVRNRFVRQGFERCLKARPANLYHPGPGAPDPSSATSRTTSIASARSIGSSRPSSSGWTSSSR